MRTLNRGRETMKWCGMAFCLAVSFPISAQPTDSCAGLVGGAQDRCQVSQQQRQQQQLTQQQQQLTQLQQQLSQQQQQLAQQQEQLAQQQQQIAKQQEYPRKYEILSQQLESEKAANHSGAPRATEYLKGAEVKRWKAENTWFGSDYPRTQFAMRYAKQLQKEQPDLVGRPLLDAISAKVTDKFGAMK